MIYWRCSYELAACVGSLCQTMPVTRNLVSVWVVCHPVAAVKLTAAVVYRCIEGFSPFKSLVRLYC